MHGRGLITWCRIVHNLPSTLTFAAYIFAVLFAAGLDCHIISAKGEITAKMDLYKSRYDKMHKKFTAEFPLGNFVTLYYASKTYKPMERII